MRNASAADRMAEREARGLFVVHRPPSAAGGWALGIVLVFVVHAVLIGSLVVRACG